ncbi:hypothetical protein K438DRAFT_672887 [Mycena galopus ATCC 62051]|nr:hypothetical protein K438DRAFT_672887 [Mycena galopus ATCC 62051]
MLNFILHFIACIAFLVSQIDSIRCRALTAAQQTIDGAVLVVVGALKAKNPFRVLPPATKTSLVWISPSTTTLSQHPPPLSLSLGLYFIWLSSPYPPSSLSRWARSKSAQNRRQGHESGHSILQTNSLSRPRPRRPLSSWRTGKIQTQG